MTSLSKALTQTQLVSHLVKTTVVPSRKASVYGGVSPVLSTKYGGRHRVTLIHGDGIGPEMMFHIKEVIRHVRAPVEFEDILLNSKTVSESMIEQTLMAIKRNGACIKGNLLTDHNNPVARSVNVVLRKRLNLFANVLRCKGLPTIKTRHSDIDILIIRENTEGEYSNLEHESVPGVVECLKVITEERSMRIAEFAFARADAAGRKKVTAVHKANIMKLSDGLFLRSCKKVAESYPHIKFETMIVDNTCMQLVAKPSQFDVMVMPNLYGNIVANVCTGLVGGAGLVAGSNYGDGCAIFEKGTRNSGKGIAGRNTANPSGMLFAAAYMLKYIGLSEYGSAIKNAIVNTIVNHNVKTADMGGSATTTDFMKKVVEELLILTPEIGFGASKPSEQQIRNIE